MSSPGFKEVMSSATVAGPAPEEKIQAAERELSLRFPPEYRTFLRTFGAVTGTGFEIAGIFVEDDSGPPRWRDIVKATKRFRKAVSGKLPETLIPISDDGCGVSYYIDASKQHEDRCAVVAYGPGIDGGTVAGSLAEFVVKMGTDELNV